MRFPDLHLKDIHLPHLPRRSAEDSHSHRGASFTRFERAEGALDKLGVAFIILLAAAAVYGILAATGSMPW